jgi:hypothetical protein
MTKRSILQKMARLLPVPLGLLLSGVLVWQASYAAFIGSTSNSGNSWSVGTVNLSNDSGGVPMFQVTNMTPGDTGSHCILITSASTVPTTVKLYSSSTAHPANDISQYINLTIEQGTGGTFANCAAFTPISTAFNGDLETFDTTHTNYANGVGPWALDGTPPDTLSFRFTWTFSASAPPTTQNGQSDQVTFTWEAQH